MSAAAAIAWPGSRLEAGLAAFLLVLHAVLVSWGIAANSVTYDENFHVSAGVAHLARGEPGISTVNPPLAKMMFGAAAIAAGAVAPSDSTIRTRDQGEVGESFMRLNAAHYHSIFAAARCVSLGFSLVLAVVVWRVARRRAGAVAGLLALVLWTLAPEALAHAGVATMDMATALGWTASALALDRFITRARWQDGVLLGAAAVFLALTRFSAVLLVPLALMLIVLHAVRRRMAEWRRVLVGLALLVPLLWLAFALAYQDFRPTRPIEELTFRSQTFRGLALAWPRLRLPLPSTLVDGLDNQLAQNQAGHLEVFALGRRFPHPFWWYFPFAILCKWPIALIAAVLARLALAPWDRGRYGAGFWLPPAVFLGGAMVLSAPNTGLRYVLPVLPFAAIACGDLAAMAEDRMAFLRRRAGAIVFAVMTLGMAGETLAAAPWWISFFNRFTGDTAHHELILNDSNVDWGQGLLALRARMKQLGIHRIYFLSHGTVDPAIYGIDYVPYHGGVIGSESNWLAISSYFYVGLPARIMTQTGYSSNPWVFDTSGLRSMQAGIRVGDCIWLIRIR
jgi:4-amino-4-deoxy-L-arabinose transferase-like glycosyltransferase